MSLEEYQSNPFSFIICGGGTAGLVLASRLSENPKFNVLVVEAGSDRRDDPMVNNPGAYIHLYDNPKYDWSFKTVPQPGTQNVIHSWPRGKGLGGSSMINFMCYSHCSKQDIDNWAALGNEGWGWDDLVPYMHKAEHFHPPSDEAKLALGTDYINSAIRGTDGPMQIGFPQSDFTWVQKNWSQLSRNMGYPLATDPRSGVSLGAFNQLVAINPDTATRSYAANTYLELAKNRPNLTVLTEAVVQKILLDGKTEPTARGVEVLKDGKTFIFTAEKEVLLCAGSLQTPQLLELSGIGRRDILEKYGIDVIVENENVGENLQDHLIPALAWEVKEGVPTTESLRDNPHLITEAMEMYAKDHKGPLTNTMTSSGFLDLETVAPGLRTEQLVTSDPKLPTAQSKVQAAQLHNPTEGTFQLIAVPGGVVFGEKRISVPSMFLHQTPGNYGTIALALSHPFSRGSCHIQSADVHTLPVVDPRYLSHPMDLEALAHGLLHLQKMVVTAPIADFFKDAPGKQGKEKRLMPGIPPCSTLDEARTAVPYLACTQYHPIATCSMLPREEGGVVNKELKVYGVKGLRIVDASIFPLHVQGNIQSLVYATAEKAADDIKAEYGVA